jgi:uncharacterized protein YfaS (alpha-2-macroglobulin family)
LRSCSSFLSPKSTRPQLNRGYIEEIKLPSLTEKGLSSAAARKKGSNVTNVRKEFKTLAFWQGSLKTGKDGKAEFSFTAPDNLTTYRLVAVGKRRRIGRFGGDANATAKVSNRCLSNAALPRFLRDGDEVELRAVVQQNFVDSEGSLRVVTTRIAN